MLEAAVAEEHVLFPEVKWNLQSKKYGIELTQLLPRRFRTPEHGIGSTTSSVSRFIIFKLS